MINLAEKIIVVRKRYGNEQLDVREFVRPTSYMAWQQSEKLWRASRDKADFARRCLDYVVHQVKYPPGPPESHDWHAMYAHKGTGRMLVHHEAEDFWNFPSETLRDMIGDCDDKAILLTSLLRRAFSLRQVYCTVGVMNGIGHMWGTIVYPNSLLVLETTRPVPPLMETAPYQPIFRFNDRMVVMIRSLNDIPLLHRPVRT